MFGAVGFGFGSRFGEKVEKGNTFLRILDVFQFKS